MFKEMVKKQFSLTKLVTLSWTAVAEIMDVSKNSQISWAFEIEISFMEQ